MARVGKVATRFRIVIERPVPGVSYSLQSRDNAPLGAQTSRDGAALTFDFTVVVGPGPSFAGDQIRREGPERRFVHVRIGQLAGDPASPWSRRMKVDVHQVPGALLARAAATGGTIVLTVDGTAADGTPACATVPVGYSLTGT